MRLLVGGLALALLLPAVPAEASVDPAAYVDPLIGSARDGNTWPGAVRPFGMISWSPTSTRGDQTSTGAANGYQYDTTRVRGFSLTHVNGAGCNPGAAGDVPIMPYAGEVDSSPTADTTDAKYASNFSHADEVAKPGRYTVKLANGVTSDLAVTTRAGVGDFAFPTDGQPNLLFRTSNSLNGSQDAEITIDPANRKVTGSVLTGAFCGRRANGGTNNRKIVLPPLLHRLVRPADRCQRHLEGRHADPGQHSDHGRRGIRDRCGPGRPWVRWIRQLRARCQGADADRHLVREPGRRRAEPARPKCGRMRRSNRIAADGYREWKNELQNVKITGGSEAQRTTFYTALYHSMLQPNIFNDVDGRYLGTDQQIHQLARGPAGAVRDVLRVGSVPGAHPVAGVAEARHRGRLRAVDVPVRPAEQRDLGPLAAQQRRDPRDDGRSGRADAGDLRGDGRQQLRCRRRLSSHWCSRQRFRTRRPRTMAVARGNAPGNDPH